MFSRDLPDPTADQIQLLMERLVRARWIEKSIVTQDPFVIIWSRRGRERMAVVRDIVKDLFPRSFNPDARPCGQIASVKHVWRLTMATRELRWPRITKQEERVLLGIAATLHLAEDGLPTPVYSIRQ